MNPEYTQTLLLIVIIIMLFFFFNAKMKIFNWLLAKHKSVSHYKIRTFLFEYTHCAVHIVVSVVDT